MTKTTIYDIAKAANCSAATVSLALNNSNRIKPETKQHILSIAAQLNYVPNYVAKSLISSTTNSIGLIVPNVENPLFSMMISGIENYANNNGYNIILGLTEADEQREDFYLDMLQRRQVDGLILFPSFFVSSYIGISTLYIISYALLLLSTPATLAEDPPPPPGRATLYVISTLPFAPLPP